MNKLLLALAVCAAAEASAQHHGHPASPPPAPASSAYAGEQAREIKALSAQEQHAWLEGQGAGLAKAAELNSYPGPMHVLELAAQLSLTEAQQKRTHELMVRHKAEVRSLGAELVASERELDDLFRSKRATPAEVNAMTQRLGSLQARIRASHLNTHIEQVRMLQPEQIATYDSLRGYSH